MDQITRRARPGRHQHSQWHPGSSIDRSSTGASAALSKPVSLLKKSLSERSVVRNTQEPGPKHYKSVDLKPLNRGQNRAFGSFSTDFSVDTTIGEIVDSAYESGTLFQIFRSGEGQIVSGMGVVTKRQCCSDTSVALSM